MLHVNVTNTTHIVSVMTMTTTVAFSFSVVAALDLVSKLVTQPIYRQFKTKDMKTRKQSRPKLWQQNRFLASLASYLLDSQLLFYGIVVASSFAAIGISSYAYPYRKPATWQ